MLAPKPTAFENPHDSSSEDEPPLELEPVRVASLLRELQRTVTLEGNSTLVLDLDESLHVAAHPALLRSALFALMQHARLASGSAARMVSSCRAEDSGVAIEVESERGAGALGFARLSEAGLATPPSLAVVELALAAMDGSFSFEELTDDGYVLGLHFPLLSKRLSSVPPPSYAMHR